MEEYNLRVFIMVTHSVCGALPLGIMLTSDEKQQTLEDALQLFKSCLPDFSFHGASPTTGPKVFMTDNCYELREALKNVWPNATTVLCIFHVLQQVMPFLCIFFSKQPIMCPGLLFIHCICYHPLTNMYVYSRCMYRYVCTY